MAFESQEIKSKYYHGFTKLKVLGVNPNKSELEAMGFKPKDEPNYMSNDKSRVTFYLKDTVTGVIYNYAFFVENTPVKSNNGEKYQYINAKGQSWWNTEPTPLQQWQSTEGIRVAVKGEADLIDFVKVWLSAYKTAQFETEQLEAFAKGDVTSLKAMAIENSDKLVGALVGIQQREDKFYNKVGTFCGSKSTPEKYAVSFQKFIDSNAKFTTEYFFGLPPFELTEVEDPSTLQFNGPTEASQLIAENEL